MAARGAFADPPLALKLAIQSSELVLGLILGQFGLCAFRKRRPSTALVGAGTRIDDSLSLWVVSIANE